MFLLRANVVLFPMLLFAIASPVRAGSISVLSNIPGTGTTPAYDLTTTSWAAVGLTTSSSAVTFASLTGYFESSNGGTLDGGIYSNASGSPGVKQATFNSVAVPGTDPIETLTTTSPFTLQASTSYWFVLSDFSSSVIWLRPVTNTAPTAATGYTFLGYMDSSNTGSSWSTGSENAFVDIDVTPLSSTVPEPATIAMFISGFLCFAAYRWRRRQQPVLA